MRRAMPDDEKTVTLTRAEITRILAENGISGNQADLHSWRCEYPDRYGKCECVESLIDDLMGEGA